MGIALKNIHKSFGEQHVLRGIDLEFKTGEITAVIGPSGTGKSVLLKIIMGLMPSNTGEVLIGNRSMTNAKDDEERREIRKELGVLFQFAALFDSMTVYDNIAFPLRYGQNSIGDEKKVKQRTLTAIEEVGMSGMERSYPGEISIGMRKRVGVARALVTKPKVILFDEPNTGLDPEMGHELYQLIRKSQEEYDFTGIVISHEIPEVFEVCSRAVLLYEGGVQFDGDYEEFKQSEKAIVKQFREGSVEGPIQM